jgi:hypothetical protein
MSQTKLFAASAVALIVACIAGWATSDTSAAVTPTVRIDAFAAMTSAKQLPTEHFEDYSFVFN